MTEKYPVPSYAANIWIAGDKLWLGFPSPEPGVRGHSVPLPCNEKGMAVAVSILREREHTPRTNWLGTKGAPTRWDIEHDKKYNALLNAMNESKKTTEAEKAAAQAFLEELGL